MRSRTRTEDPIRSAERQFGRAVEVSRHARDDSLMLPPDPSVLPPPLDSLDPAQMARWAISDDVDRDRAIVDARADGLELLVSVFDAWMFEALNALFDSHGEHPPESVCWLLDVGQAAMEARMELDNRQR